MLKCLKVRFLFILKLLHLMLKSKYKKLNIRDFVRSLIVSFWTTFSALAMQTLMTYNASGEYSFSMSMFKPALFAGLMAACGYLITNFFTNAKGQLHKPEN